MAATAAARGSFSSCGSQRERPGRGVRSAGAGRDRLAVLHASGAKLARRRTSKDILEFGGDDTHKGWRRVLWGMHVCEEPRGGRGSDIKYKARRSCVNLCSISRHGRPHAARASRRDDGRPRRVSHGQGPGVGVCAQGGGRATGPRSPGGRPGPSWTRGEPRGVRGRHGAQTQKLPHCSHSSQAGRVRGLVFTPCTTTSSAAATSTTRPQRKTRVKGEVHTPHHVSTGSSMAEAKKLWQSTFCFFAPRNCAICCRCFTCAGSSASSAQRTTCAPWFCGFLS